MYILVTREQNKRRVTMNFLIRQFPGELHKALKLIAVKEGKPLYQVIIEILTKAIEKDKNETL